MFNVNGYMEYKFLSCLFVYMEHFKFYYAKCIEGH